MPVKNTEVQYHIGLSQDQLCGARYALLPGDPGRVTPIAKVFDRHHELGQHREYRSAIAYVDRLPILVMSTGIGSPSTAIAVEELARIGIQYFIRLGTTGTIQPQINLGDVIISEAAVRLEGTSQHYAPLEYPATGSITLTNSLCDAARRLGIPTHVGITCSSDSFWPGQERYDSFTGYVLRRFNGSVEEWRRLGVLNFEMETAALFIVCRVFGLEAASLCGVIAQRTESEAVRKDVYDIVQERLSKIAKTAISIHQTTVETR
jgi:uridine phosphorylase